MKNIGQAASEIEDAIDNFDVRIECSHNLFNVNDVYVDDGMIVIKVGEVNNERFYD